MHINRASWGSLITHPPVGVCDCLESLAVWLSRAHRCVAYQQHRVDVTLYYLPRRTPLVFLRVRNDMFALENVSHLHSEQKEQLNLKHGQRPPLFKAGPGPQREDAQDTSETLCTTNSMSTLLLG